MKKTIGYLAIESLLIIFSIISAFWLEGMRQSREDNKIRTDYYINIINELREDSIQYEKILRTTRDIGDLIADIQFSLQASNPNSDTLAYKLWKLEAEFF